MMDVLPQQFDPILHAGARITIMSRMVIHQSMRFGDLRKSTTLTQGNLASHLDVLERAGYVRQDVDETKVARPKTVRITAAGDQAFRAYVAQVRAVLDGVQASLPAAPGGA